MRTMTATEAARNFSDLLDSIERGETVTITRGQRAVAEMRPARIPPPDEQFAANIADAKALIASEEADPWIGA
jgi:antitoxin (DNA-binding transcriptional repressor) of toxin-antitoxin stability system